MIEVTPGSHNVFLDLGFDPDEAINLKVRADLMLDLRSHIQTEGWTCQEAARSLDEPQARVEALLCCDLDQFSLDELIALATKVGMDVKVEAVAAG
jgi:predicted XRE-type DNA-binding protein